MTQHSGEPNLEDDRLIFVDSVPNETVDKINTWKVMLVDDKAEAHQVARLALQKFKFEDKPLQFISAYSADEAQQLIEAHPDTALILLDIVMPLENGLAVLKQIIHLNIKSRIIMVSAVDTPAILADCIALGIDDFVVKPFEVQSLQQAIQNVMKWEIGSNEQSQVTDRR